MENDNIDIEKMAEEALLDESNMIKEPDSMEFGEIEGCEE